MKKRNFMILLLVTAFLAGCGNVTEDVITNRAEVVESTEGTENLESTQGEAAQTENENNEPVEDAGNIDSDGNTESDADMSAGPTYTEKGNLYLLEDVPQNPEAAIDMNALEIDGSKYKLVSSVNIYQVDMLLAGYTKEDFLVHVIRSDDEWSYCDLGAETENYLIKTDELMEAISEQDKKMLIAASATPTPAPTEKKHTENPPAASAPAASTPVPSESAESTPVPEPPAAEQPAAEEGDKYTPEEAIAVYRSIMETNGITWDPTIKEYASWGTGFIFLNKGWIDENAYSQVEAYKMGDTVGNSFTRYYLEVTGSDENCVYVTEWGCD